MINTDLGSGPSTVRIPDVSGAISTRHNNFIIPTVAGPFLTSVQLHRPQ